MQQRDRRREHAAVGRAFGEETPRGLLDLLGGGETAVAVAEIAQHLAQRGIGVGERRRPCSHLLCLGPLRRPIELARVEGVLLDDVEALAEVLARVLGRDRRARALDELCRRRWRLGLGGRGPGFLVPASDQGERDEGHNDPAPRTHPSGFSTSHRWLRHYRPFVIGDRACPKL